MHRLTVLYGHPADPEHFKAYYLNVHLPLAARMPHATARRYSFAVSALGAESPFFCIYEADYADADAMQRSTESPEGMAVADDIRNYASGGATVLHFPAQDALETPRDWDTVENDGTIDDNIATRQKGLAVRSEMFSGMPGGPPPAPNAFMQPFDDMVTRYCFGEVWTRRTLDRKTRSLLTLALLAALSKPNQIKLHTRGALTNGASVEEIREVLLHAMIYAGVPAAVEAFGAANQALTEAGKV